MTDHEHDIGRRFLRIDAVTLKGGKRGVTFFRRIYLITLEPFDLAAEHVWRGTFLWCQAHPTTRVRCPVLSNFGVPFYFCVHPLTLNYVQI